MSACIVSDPFRVSLQFHSQIISFSFYTLLLYVLPRNIQYVHDPNSVMRPIIQIVGVYSHHISISFKEAMQSGDDRLHDSMLSVESVVS